MKTLSAIVVLVDLLIISLMLSGCDVVAQEALDEAARLAGKSAQVTYHPPTITVESPAPTPDPKPAPNFDRQLNVTTLLAQLCMKGGAVDRECFKNAALCVAKLDDKRPDLLAAIVNCGVGE